MTTKNRYSNIIYIQIFTTFMGDYFQLVLPKNKEKISISFFVMCGKMTLSVKGEIHGFKYYVLLYQKHTSKKIILVNVSEHSEKVINFILNKTTE